ncbi:TPA: hypothetical protein DCR49_12270 [Candidatus Delongbacteria bacterium]|nr:hypothetical protein [Candidatus Delongbacteria bacterium]
MIKVRTGASYIMKNRFIVLNLLIAGFLFNLLAFNSVINNGHTGNISELQISPSGKYLVSASSEDYTLKLWDFKTGRELRTFSGFSDLITGLYFDEKSMTLAAGDRKGKLKIFKADDGSVLKEKTNPDKIVIHSSLFSKECSFSTTSDFINFDLWDINAREIINSKKLPLLPIVNNTSSYYFVKNTRNAVLIEFGKITIIDITTGEVVKRIPLSGYWIRAVTASSDGSFLAASLYDGTSGGLPDNRTVYIWDMKNSFSHIKTIRGEDSEIYPKIITNDNTFLICTDQNNGIRKYDIKTGKLLKRADNIHQVSVLLPDNNGKMILTGDFNGNISFYTIENLALKKRIEGNSPYFKIKGFSIDNNENLIIIFSPWSLSVFDLRKLYNIASMKSKSQILCAAISPDGKYAATSQETGEINIYSTGNLKLLGSFHAKKDSYSKLNWSISFSEDSRMLHYGHKSFTFSLNLDNVMSQLSSTELKSEKNRKEPYEFKSSNGRIYELDDGRINISNSRDSEIILTLVPLGLKDYIFITPDNYYSISKTAINKVNFVEGLKTFSFDNFDLSYNRPDLISARLFPEDKKNYQIFHASYLKRLENLGFSEITISDKLQIPEIKILNKDIPIDIDNKSFELKISASDSLFNLDRINIYINSVPVFGSKGYSLKDKEIKSYVGKFLLELSDGENIISVSALNVEGAESIKENFSLKYNGLNTKHDLYVIALGTSKYVESEYNLEYAAKDAQDISNMFGNMKESFNKIYTMTLTDKEVTGKSVKYSKGFFKNSKPDDTVILFIAGHGMLDKDLNYYYGAYDTNFSNPSTNGIPYSEIENLLDSIPSRNKILLIDTCHSGEIDKSESELKLNYSTSEGSVKSRAIKITRVQNKYLGLENSFELMKALFSDLRNSNGAIIISASGGAEYALESDKWKNGVFTYSVIEALTRNKADLNYDENISVSELSEYVLNKVSELTQGKQKPTIRQENIINDFMLKKSDN